MHKFWAANAFLLISQSRVQKFRVSQTQNNWAIENEIWRYLDAFGVVFDQPAQPR